MDRRTFLGAACCAAASPLVTPVVFAAAPGENRLVVIVLRGGLDGLGVVQPHGDRGFWALRPGLGLDPRTGLADLDGFFGLHPAFDAMMGMWRAGDLGFVHAVSTPYRHKRSHFDGQDFLENGGGDADGSLTPGRDGWLNRALGQIPGANAEYAMAVGQGHLMLLHGKTPAAAWSPTNELSLSNDERMLLTRLYGGDPLFASALEGAVMLSDADGKAARRESGKTLAAFAARRLNGASRIAAFSLGGWDTHRRQDRAIARPARQRPAKTARAAPTMALAVSWCWPAVPCAAARFLAAGRGWASAISSKRAT